MRSELHSIKVGASESPESGESGRGAGVEFHSVAGESCCAGVQVLYLTRALIYAPSTGVESLTDCAFLKSKVCKILFHTVIT